METKIVNNELYVKFQGLNHQGEFLLDEELFRFLIDNEKDIKQWYNLRDDSSYFNLNDFLQHKDSELISLHTELQKVYLDEKKDLFKTVLIEILDTTREEITSLNPEYYTPLLVTVTDLVGMVINGYHEEVFTTKELSERADTLMKIAEFQMSHHLTHQGYRFFINLLKNIVRYQKMLTIEEDRIQENFRGVK